MAGCWVGARTSLRSTPCAAASVASEGRRTGRACRPRPGLALMISDVPGDDPAVIGSGCCIARPARSGCRVRCRSKSPSVLARCPDPEAVRRHRGWRRASSPRTVMPGGGTPPRPELRTARGALRARRILGRRGRSRPNASRGASPPPRRARWVWGGESTVVLPPSPGRGGRNQQLALAAALEIGGSRQGCHAARCGDRRHRRQQRRCGRDRGATRPARAERPAGLDGPGHLLRADSGTFLEECGDLLHTAPPTNVGDLVLGSRSKRRDDAARADRQRPSRVPAVARSSRDARVGGRARRRNTSPRRADVCGRVHRFRVRRRAARPRRRGGARSRVAGQPAAAAGVSADRLFRTDRGGPAGAQCA